MMMPVAARSAGIPITITLDKGFERAALIDSLEVAKPFPLLSNKPFKAPTTVSRVPSRSKTTPAHPKASVL
jgi:hypothetical protein